MTLTAGEWFDAKSVVSLFSVVFLSLQHLQAFKTFIKDVSSHNRLAMILMP